MKLKKFKEFLECFVFTFFIGVTYANECKINTNLKVGIIENNYINYKHYLYYTLGDYSSKNLTEFELETVNNNNISNFDIIFGEYHELKKLSLNNINYPNEIEEFYLKNKVEISNNIFPLDLDTFILLSKGKIMVADFEELVKLRSPVKYTLGFSLKSKKHFIDFFTYNAEDEMINFNAIKTESILGLMSQSFKNLNKNILNVNFDDSYNSYAASENIFTLFSDGILLYKNIDYETFQLYPKSKYDWDKNKGMFIDDNYIKPTSFFGFSAYLQNSNHSGFLCYLLDENVRNYSFKNFNIQLSPLSIEEISKDTKIDENYKKILLEKNKNIINPDYKSNLEYFDLIKGIIYGHDKYINFVEGNSINN